VSSSHSLVLLVEDDSDTRALVRQILEQHGYEVVEARHGREALDKLDVIGHPCLILLDLMMPVMNGEEMLAVLRATDSAKSIPVVIVSAYDARARALSGTSGVIKKPMNLASLMSVVRRHCPEPQRS
jgi:CheY-like chemotaxis protein